MLKVCDHPENVNASIDRGFTNLRQRCRCVAQDPETCLDETFATIEAGHDPHEMDESENAEEDLLSFLQPLTTPDEFTFETRTRPFEDSSDDDADEEPIPGPAPPAPMASAVPVAPMAPMAPMEPIAPIDLIDSTAPVAPEAVMTAPNGVASLPTPKINGHEEDKTVIEQDEDAIEYETPKATRKNSAKRPIRSRATPTARRDAGDESPNESAAELLKRFATSSAKKRVEAKPDREGNSKTNGGSPGKRKAREESVGSVGFEAESSPDPWKFEVVIKPLPPAAAQEYTKVPPGDEIYRVLDVIKTDVPGEAWLSVEYEDGRVDQVSHRTSSFQSKHRLARLTSSSSHLCNNPFGNKPSGKLSLRLPGTPLPPSSLQQYRSQYLFYSRPKQARANCHLPLLGIPVSTAKYFQAERKLGIQGYSSIIAFLPS